MLTAPDKPSHFHQTQWKTLRHCSALCIFGVELHFQPFMSNLNSWQLHLDLDRSPNFPRTPDPFHKKYMDVQLPTYASWARSHFSWARVKHVEWLPARPSFSAPSNMRLLETRQLFNEVLTPLLEKSCEHGSCLVWKQTFALMVAFPSLHETKITISFRSKLNKLV